MTKSEFIKILSQFEDDQTVIYFVHDQTAEILPIDRITFSSNTPEGVYMLLHDRRTDKRNFPRN